MNKKAESDYLGWVFILLSAFVAIILGSICESLEAQGLLPYICYLGFVGFFCGYVVVFAVWAFRLLK